MCMAGCRWDREERPSFPPRATEPNAPATVAIDLGNGVELKMVLIQPGTFVMGTPGPNAPGWEKQHKVTLTKPYYMGIYEVTTEQYKHVMGEERELCYEGPTMPAMSLTWREADEFCRRASKLAGATIRLPTEAEWEYACRAGSATRYCFGDDPNKLGEYAWFEGNSTVHNPDAEMFPNTHQARPVGLKKPNAFGLYDMHGNAQEWCWDFAGAYSGQDEVDPMGPASSDARMLRGGSYVDGLERCRSASRDYTGPGYPAPPDGGIRVVME